MGYSLVEQKNYLGKKIFVSERIYAYAATEEAWRAAREKNTLELLKNPPIGGAAK